MLYENENKELINIYNQIKDKIIINEHNDIKIGDYIIFKNNNADLKGLILKIINEKYIVKTNNKELIVLFDQIIEHYPKNIEFSKRGIIKEDFLKDETINNETIKNNAIILFPNETTKIEIDEKLKKLKNIKYYIVERNKELHIVKIKNGFEIKIFVEELINYLLKNNIIKTNISKMKIVGNDNFCIISNYPPDKISIIKNLLQKLLK